jgi:hypothetical protein
LIFPGQNIIKSFLAVLSCWLNRILLIGLGKSAHQIEDGQLSARSWISLKNLLCWFSLESLPIQASNVRKHTAYGFPPQPSIISLSQDNSQQGRVGQLGDSCLMQRFLTQPAACCSYRVRGWLGQVFKFWPQVSGIMAVTYQLNQPDRVRQDPHFHT